MTRGADSGMQQFFACRTGIPLCNINLCKEAENLKPLHESLQQLIMLFADAFKGSQCSTPFRVLCTLHDALWLLSLQVPKAVLLRQRHPLVTSAINLRNQPRLP